VQGESATHRACGRLLTPISDDRRMFNASRLLTTTTLLLTIALPVGEAIATATSGAPTPEPSVVLVGMSPAEEATATHVVDLFAEAGLDLPHVEIRRHHDTEGCNGHEGLHRVSGASSVIDICTEDNLDWTGRTITHELGHAWSFHYLTPAARASFQQVRGWDQWLTNDNAWEDNGAEQAAEIIVWGVSDHAVPVVKIDDNSCADLLAGYVALTGLAPLHGYTDLCDDSSVSHVS
jgi:hypothetical protein